MPTAPARRNKLTSQSTPWTPYSCSKRPLAGGAITSAYDAPKPSPYAIGRVTTHTSDLGAFTLSYLGQTGQITGRALASSTLATSWSYLTNAGDRRLSGINNTGLSAGQYSNYSFTTTPDSASRWSRYCSRARETIVRAIPNGEPIGMFGKGIIFLNGAGYEFHDFGLGAYTSIGTYFQIY